jgi:hypothetical protein
MDIDTLDTIAKTLSAQEILACSTDTATLMVHFPGAEIIAAQAALAVEIQARETMERIYTLYSTQGGGTVYFDEDIKDFVFVEPAPSFSRGDIMPYQWSIA